MKKVSLIFLIVVGMTSLFSSCSKTGSTTPPTCTTCNPPPPPPIPIAPTGTITVTSSSIAYNQKDTLNWILQIAINDTVKVYVNGVLMSGIFTTINNQGSYYTAPLLATTVFTVRVVGKGGEFTVATTINVGLDPRITHLISAEFDYISIIGKALDSTNWITGAPPSYNRYVFYWQNFSAEPGNDCIANNSGSPITFKWYFTGATDFRFHGVTYDQFAITSPSSFKLHSFGTILVWNSTHTSLIPVPGEYWEFFQWH